MNAETNRQAMPDVAEFVDQIRQAFGPGIRVVYAEEKGRVLGKKPRHWKAQGRSCDD